MHAGCRDSMWGSWAMTFLGDLGQGEVLRFGVQPSPEIPLHLHFQAYPPRLFLPGRLVLQSSAETNSLAKLPWAARARSGVSTSPELPRSLFPHFPSLCGPTIYV